METRRSSPSASHVGRSSTRPVTVASRAGGGVSLSVTETVTWIWAPSSQIVLRAWPRFRAAMPPGSRKTVKTGFARHSVRVTTPDPGTPSVTWPSKPIIPSRATTGCKEPPTPVSTIENLPDMGAPPFHSMIAGWTAGCKATLGEDGSPLSSGVGHPRYIMFFEFVLFMNTHGDNP